MSKQTFTTGQVLTAQQMTSLQQTALLGGDASAKTNSYTLVAADAGTAISMSNGSATTITVDTGLFAAGDIVTILNLGAGVCTITAGTATVATSGSLALAQNQGGVLRFTSASASIFFQFATPASGDIDGVTAGTGLSGGGSSGTVTITNDMATEIDAKGDLIVGTADDTFSRLAVGTDTYLLTADNSEATGLKWAAPAGGGKVLQVVNLELTSGNFTTSSSSFVDVTGLSLAITPAAATSKVMMFLTTTSSGISTSGAGNVDMRFALVRTSTILTEARFDLENNTGSTTSFGMPVTLTYLDSPNTTSATTYKLQVKKVNYSASITVQANATNKAILTLMEIGA